MTQVQIKTRFADSFLNPQVLDIQSKKAIQANETLLARTGSGSEFLGWIDLPSQITANHLKKIEEVAHSIQEKSEYLIVVGIGGSYLGTRAVLSALENPFDSYNPKKTKILYAGHHIDPVYQQQILNFLQDKEFSINVISKSGTTTEPALAFRYLYDLLVKKYGKEKANKRVVATTDGARGALKKIADENQFEQFVIPDDIGGRYSVLTPVGLLPIAVGGVSISGLVQGAQTMANFLQKEKDPVINLALRYASLRNTLYTQGKKIEVLVNYSPGLHYVTEWWKQLYGESEGKGKKGIFPAGVNFTSDLHSMGQYIQDGERHLFETVLVQDRFSLDPIVPSVEADPDGLNYLQGKPMSFVGSKAILGTLLAHKDGGVPCLEIGFPDMTPSVLGELLYMFEYACGVSGYMLGVNPFDQPGVEDYKNNMFALLGKKGYEERKFTLEKLL